MKEICKKILSRYLDKGHTPKRVLELGSGLFSTVFIKKKLKNVGGYLVSLEDDINWYNKTKLLDDQYGHVVMSNVILDGILKYDYELSGIYDIVLIDGPGKKPLVEFGTYLKKSSHFGARNGIQSIDMLEYIWPYINKQSIVIVDNRISAVYYYLSKFDIKIKSFGHRAVSRSFLKRLRRKKESVSNFVAHECSVMKKLV